MRERLPRRVAALTLCAAVAGLALAAGAAAARRAPDPLRVTARFDRGAVLGSSTAVDVDLRLDPRQMPIEPLSEVRFEYPASLGVVSSGLGIATCSRPAQDFAQVLVTGPRLGGCPPNSVMGYGSALAIVRLLGNGQRIREYAGVTLLAGPLARGRLGLVIYVDGTRPFGAELAFAGEVSDAPPPYGGALAVRMPQVPGIQDIATVSLVDLRIAIGSHAIRYYERRGRRTVAYRPDGIALPARCPRGGFRFGAQVIFADGTRRAARSTTPCPPAVAVGGH